MMAIVTKYHGPTDTKGARISASDYNGNRVTIGYDYAAHDPYRSAAIALCKKMDWHGRLAKGSTKFGTVFVWVDDPNDCFSV